jgi:hypothetical protein
LLVLWNLTTLRVPYSTHFVNNCDVSVCFRYAYTAARPNVFQSKKKWGPEEMTNAVKGVQQDNKVELKKTVKKMAVLKTIARRLALETGKSEEDVVTKKLGRKPVLPVVAENELLVTENKFYGFIGNDANTALYQLAVRNGIRKNPFDQEGMAGRSWLHHFLRVHRHKLSLHKPCGTSLNSS